MKRISLIGLIGAVLVLIEPLYGITNLSIHYNDFEDPSFIPGLITCDLLYTLFPLALIFFFYTLYKNSK